MRIARVRYDGKTSTALVKGRSVHFVRGGPFGKLEPTGERAPLSKVRLLPPVQPGKIVAIGINYRSHAGERKPPANPEPFLKTPSSMIGHGEAIVLPRDAGRVDEEAEVVVVIGRRCRNVEQAEAADYIFGYTCGNDVSAREWQRSDLQWFRAKSSDTFTAVGPWIETDLTPERIGVIGRVNGKRVQKSHTGRLVHSIPKIVAHLSRMATLERGDLIFTGTPGATREIHAGDVVEVEVEGVGVLTNPVVDAQ